MSDWKKRLKETLEPILCRNDPRPEISAYNDVPYAIFTYPPEDEFDLRKEISLLKKPSGNQRQTGDSYLTC